jgi:hypothetical protein
VLNAVIPVVQMIQDVQIQSEIIIIGARNAGAPLLSLFKSKNKSYEY